MLNIIFNPEMVMKNNKNKYNNKNISNPISAYKLQS